MQVATTAQWLLVKASELDAADSGSVHTFTTRITNGIRKCKTVQLYFGKCELLMHDI